MNRKQTPIEQLQTIGTYVALVSGLAGLITAVISPILMYSGVRFDTNMIFALAALVFMPLLYLLYQRHKAAQRIESDGGAQRPQWLWRLLTHKITHDPQRLIKGLVMVVVPPAVRSEARTLREIHNTKKQFNLLFHFLPRPSPDNKIDEDLGESKLSEEFPPALNGFGVQSQKGSADRDANERSYRSLESLKSQLNYCAGIILIDDGGWEKYKAAYPKTWKIINDWSNRFTFRPVMSIRVEGEGTLKYSWCELNETTINNQALFGHLLKLAVDRGRDWFNHSTDQRRLFRALAFVLIAMLTLSVGVNFIFERRLRRVKAESNETIKALESDVKLIATDPADQVILAEQFASFRNSPELKVSQASAVQLLDGILPQIKNKIAEHSHRGAEVMMFAIKSNPKDPDKFAFVEVASTRRPLRHFNFSFNRNENKSESIISCAVVRRAFIHWAGVDQSSKKTKSIQGWDLEGKEIGKLDGQGIWEHQGRTCKYGPPPILPSQEYLPDDPFQYLLCAPVGVSKEPWAQPAGAICVSSVEDIELHKPWARQLLIKYGNLVSLFNWDKALAPTMKK